MGFDDFERLVDERGGIDRDLLAHRPGRMLERFGHRRARDPLGTPGAERAARRGENEPRELGRPAPRHALQDGAVLGIDRDDFAAALTRRDRKSTRLNSSHGYISYAVFCLKKKKKQMITKT